MDEYELKARVAPGLIIALPALADALYAAPILTKWPVFAASGTVTLALLHGLGHFVRARGKVIEPELWNSWGGAPSTRFVRLRDSFVGDSLKATLRHAITKTFSVRLPDADEEARNPEGTDKAIIEVFRRVRPYLRQHDPNGLWYKHDVEYGFSRNLLACRVVWTAIAVAATIFAAIYGAKTIAGMLNPASAIGLLSFICAVYVGWAVLPTATKRIADAYAESAWMTFLRISEEQRAGPATDVQTCST